jgi:tryptophan synthase alpha chain
MAHNRIVAAFADLRAAGRKGLLPFITAGYPDLTTTAALLAEFRRRGVRVCELGVPFSDPVADGPVIQASYTEALAAGVNSEAIFEMVRGYRAAEAADADPARPPLGIVAMVSYSIVYRHGVEAYLHRAAEAGFDGTIIPDLPMDEAGDLAALSEAAGLANVLLIAPTTPPDRRAEIARASRGFVYYVSVAGITGERDRLPPETVQAVAELRRHTETPICVGFGIADPQAVAAVCEAADGAIVGSAIVHRINDHRDSPPEQLIAAVGEFVGELMGPIG